MFHGCLRCDHCQSKLHRYLHGDVFLRAHDQLGFLRGQVWPMIVHSATHASHDLTELPLQSLRCSCSNYREYIVRIARQICINHFLDCVYYRAYLPETVLSFGEAFAAWVAASRRSFHIFSVSFQWYSAYIVVFAPMGNIDLLSPCW